MKGYRVNASFGVSSLKNNETIKELIRRVDSALYQAKNSGKDMVVYK